jgi:hypothetical protein
MALRGMVQVIVLGCLLGREFREILERGNVARWDGNRMGGKLAVRKFHFSGVQVAECRVTATRKYK